ncbi:ABC transporter permease [Blastococcus litoris]|uniref:ABC transporter permease n=1 Tax=Blastococcus litoris TaxID=2171622 RepID=UPI000E305143|nr:polyketide antibiotic transporter [Blastococcus litoris]
MTTRTPARAGADVDRPGPPARPGAAVTRGLVQQLRRGTLVVALLCGGLAAFVAQEYERTFSGAIGADSLLSLAENPAIRTLFGPPVALDDPGGFTVWRTGTVLAVLAGLWAALAGTRVTRGEEDAGRVDLLLSGRVRLSSLVRRSLAVLLAAGAVIGAAVVGGMLLAGTSVTGSLLFGAVLGGTAMVGGTVGVLAGQLLSERRSASGLAVGAMLAALLLRMIGDGVDALAWLQWLSPFGLASRVAPYADDRWAPLLVLAAQVLVPAVLAVVLAGDRDIGRGRWRGRDHSRAPSRLLRSLPGLAVHRTRRATATWSAGLAAYFLLIGLLATAMLDFLRENPVFAELAASSGFVRLASVQGYASSLFSLLAVPVGAYAAARIAALAADEVASRLTLLYSRPVTRVRWATWEALVVAVGTVVLAVVAGLAAWVGATVVDAGLGPWEAVGGALNAVPVALLCAGAALLALGWLPSAVLLVGVLPAAGGFLLLVLADSFRWTGWVRELSPFAHVAAVPAEPVDVAGTVGMLVVAVLLAVLGLLGYARRDLRG